MKKEITRRLLINRALAASCSYVVLTACGKGSASPTSTTSPSAPTTVTPASTEKTPAGSFQWKPLRVGAGGYVTGIDIAPDGTKVVRCDSSGAYICTKSATQWTPLCTTASMPAGSWARLGSTDVYEVAVAPSNSSRIYLVFAGQVFRTDDGGKSFTKTGLAGLTTTGRDDNRTFGRKMAIDPSNPDVVVLGTQGEGAYLTTNGGAAWQSISSVPKAASASGMRVAFDPSSPVRGGATQRVYVASQGNGVYVSNDGGATFAATSGGPTNVLHMCCDQQGTVWATEGTAAGNLRKFANGAWTVSGPTDTSFKTIAIDPANSAHIVIATWGGSIAQTFDHGATWTGIYNLGMGGGHRIANDIPWLAWTNEDFMSSGDMRFDPSSPNKLYFAEGVGVWSANPPTNYVGFDWTSQSAGIEQLCTNQFVCPPGGKPLYLAWDRPLFRIENPDVFPKTHGPNNAASIIMGWSADYANEDPKTVVALVNNFGADESGFSTDGGVTWTQFASIPDDVRVGQKIGGSIAAGSKQNFMWLPNNNGTPWYTKDGGRTWVQSSVPGTPQTGETGWGSAYYFHHYALVADKVAANTFYLYNYNGAAAGLYRSTDGGANFTKVFSGQVADWSGYHSKLYAVPGKQGHLFFTSAQQSGTHPANIALKRSTDGGATWQPVADMLEVYSVGFGAAAPGSDYPAIYAAGWYKNVYSIWRSDDNAATWTDLGANPLNGGDEVTAISGDPDVYGKVYVGFGGSGAVYGLFA